MEKTHFERVVRNKLDWTSSPGYPYLRRATSNAVFFGCVDGVPNQERVDAVWSMVQQRLLGAEPDYIRLFVKPEAHTAKKLDQKRYRLISSVSVVDQIIDHMLFDEMNDMMINNWIHIPSKPGWSFVGGGWRFMPKETWIATDASSWDWTVQPWLLEMAYQVRRRFCVNMNQKWERFAQQRYQELFASPVFVTSGGLLLRQKEPGVMKSGCVNTIADNSLMQVILHVRCCLELGLPVTQIFTMGDDRLQEPMPREREYMDLTGQFCILKSVEHVNEFAGFRIGRGRVEPVHRAKHAYNLLHADPRHLQEIANSYALNYHRSKFTKWFDDMFREMGLYILPREYRDMIFDGI